MPLEFISRLICAPMPPMPDDVALMRRVYSLGAYCLLQGAQSFEGCKAQRDYASDLSRREEFRSARAEDLCSQVHFIVHDEPLAQTTTCRAI